MNLSKWNFVSILLSLISMGNQSSSKENAEQPTKQPERHHTSTSSHPSNAPLYWEHILRESVFRTISPPPSSNNRLYRRLLEAPFHGGPFPVVANDATNVVLSRGDVYHMANGRWLFCQQGCTDCGVCIDHTHPTVKWELRRVKRASSHGSARHDLQLTIVPQMDGSYHMKSLWPQSYIYVTSQGEQDTYLNEEYNYRNDGGAYVSVDARGNGTSGRQGKAKNFWVYVDRNSLPDIRVVGRGSNDSAFEYVENSTRYRVESTSVMPKGEDVGEGKNGLKNVSSQRPGVKTVEKQRTNRSSTDVGLKENGIGRVKQLVPKLILGTDQLGQKHLVHVVPADASTNTSSMNSVMSNVLNSVGQNKTAYQRILRRIFDSLNSNRRSIETFLEPVMTTGNLERLNQQDEVHQEQETRSGFPRLRHASSVYPAYNRGTSNDSMFQRRWPYTLNWNKQHRVFNDDALVNRFVNNATGIDRKSNSSYSLYPKVQNSVAQNNNASDRFHFKLIENNYDNNTFHNSFKANNVTRNSNEYKFIPRRYKISVTTESTSKFDEIANQRLSKS